MSAQVIERATLAQDEKCRQLRKQGWRFSVNGDTITAKNGRLNQEKIADSWDEVIAMAERVPVPEINKAEQELINLGLLSDPNKIADEITAAEEAGWEIFQEEDGSFVAEHQDLGLRTRSGETFIKYNAVRAAVWMQKHEETGAEYDEWFRHIKVINDLNEREISDLPDKEILEAIKLHEVANQAYAEALRLELKLRDEEFSKQPVAEIPVPEKVLLPHTAYHQFRKEVAGLSLIELLSDLERANRSTDFEPRKLQALRDEANVRGGMSVDENGIYQELEETEVLYIEQAFVNARILLLNTSEMVGWIYGYSWLRGKQKGEKSLTAREAFDTRDDALRAAVAALQNENVDYLEYTSPLQAQRAAQIYKWAESLLHPEQEPEISEAGSSLALVENDPAPVEASLFDYSALDSETVEQAKDVIRDTNEVVRRSLVDAIRIGSKLSIMKRKLAGRYEEWVEKEFPGSPRFARNCLQVFDSGIRPGEGMEKVQITLIYEITRDSTPPAARKEIEAIVASGETVTKETVTKVITKHKEEERQKAPPLIDISPEPREPKNEGDERGDTSVKQEIEAEIVTTGRTNTDLLAFLKVSPGLNMEAILKMGFKEHQLTSLQDSRAIDKRNDRYFYCWKPQDIADLIRENGPQRLMQLEEAGCSKYSIECAKMDNVIKLNAAGAFVLFDTADAEPGNESPAFNAAPPNLQLEEKLAGRSLTIAFSVLPAMPGSTTVSVRVGDHLPDTAFNALPLAIIENLPPEVIEMLTLQLEALQLEKPVKKATTSKTKPKMEKKSTPAKKTGTPAKTKTVKKGK
jgi:hypothetical protein